MIRYQTFMHALLVLSVCLLTLTGCAPGVATRIENANELANRSGWHGITIETSAFPLYGFTPDITTSTDTLTVYIEGDGMAWRSRRRVSENPTPARPLGLRMALQHQQTAAYLARPCQYLDDAAACNQKYWTSGRYSEDVVGASNEGVERFKQLFGARQLRLVGYSGGGAIAALVAARRQDVIQLVTIAGNLDHAAWTRLHRVSPLSESLNPADHWQALAPIPQVHLVGAQDTIVPVDIAKSYRERFPADRQPEVRVINHTDHLCCWTALWPELQQTVFQQK